MTDEIVDGTGASQRAHHAGGDAPVRGPRRRMSAERKQSAVLRLLRGEPIELVSRALGGRRPISLLGAKRFWPPVRRR